MEAAIEKYMSTLNECLTLNARNKSTDAKTNVINISKYFEEELSRAEIDAAFVVLFDKKVGILNFVAEALKQEGFSDAIKESFALISYILNEFKDRISPHILETRDVCKTCVMLAKTAEEKDRAFEALMTIIVKEPWDVYLRWDDIFNIILRPFTMSNVNRTSKKLLQRQLHIMGMLARRHPDCIKDSDRPLLLKIYISQLEMQIKFVPAVKYQVIVGCLTGLTEYLHYYPLEPEDCMKIYGFVKAVSQKHKELKVAPRVALVLLQEHGNQFSQHLFADYIFWHDQLLKVASSTGEDHKVGVRTLDVFYKLVVQNLQTSRKESGEKVFQYFITHFKNQMLSKETSPNVLKLVIKGFGLFAGPCRTYMKPADVKFMFTIIVQQAEQMYLRREEDMDEMVIENLADYVEALSSIMAQLENVSSEQLSSLQYLSVLLLENFPKLTPSFRFFAISAIAVTMCNVMSVGGTALDDFLTHFIYQGVIRCCSHEIAIDVDLQKDNMQRKVITYKDYVPIWTALLSTSSYNNKEAAEVIVGKVYDELVHTTLILISKLDLNTRPKKTEGESVEDVPVLDPETGLEANTSKDFKVFINLVDLIIDVLSRANYKLFEKWIQLVSHQIIQEALRKPLVSGFYKLLTLTLELCDKNEYFTWTEGVYDQPDDRRSIFLVLCSFLQKILVQMQQYKNDLQVACLKTILAAPITLVVPLLHKAAPAFEAVFRVGQSMLPLARLGLSALAKWSKVLPQDVMKPLYKQVLPYLDPFLRSKGVDGTADVAIKQELMVLSRKRCGAFSRNKKSARKATVERPDSHLSQFQNEIIAFIGQLDSTTCLMMLRDPYVESDSIPWAACLKESLTLPLPFDDMKLKIKLEKLLPRVVELALSSSDRSTRFTACELLHAIIMFMLGTAHKYQTSDPDRYAELFRKLCMPLLRLGCDPDQAIQSLFSILVLQLVHWYSSKFMFRSKETSFFIESLLDGISHPTGTALRDFCAKNFREFVVWSIKQVTDLELKNSPVNIKAIMKEIYAFCQHPCPSKRLGAALILNSIYTVLREKEEIINQFWLELLYHMVMNLSQAEEVDSIPGSQKQVVDALEHIERVLREKANLFNKKCNRRRKPPEFDGITLKDAVCWLLVKCGSIQPDCRHQCMKLVDILALKLPDCKSRVDFMDWYISTYSVTSLLKICEENGGRGIAITPTIQHLPSNSSLPQVIQWLQLLLSSLDCYVWLCGSALIKPSVLLLSSDSRMFEAMIFFIENMSGSDANAAVKLMGSSSETPDVVTWEMENYERTKCFVIVRVLDFMSVVLQSSEPACLPEALLSSRLWHMIAKCVLLPSSLGFDLRSTEVLNGLPDNLISLLKVLLRTLSKSYLAELISEISKIIVDLRAEIFGKQQEILKYDKVSIEQKQFLLGLMILHKSGMLMHIPDCKFDGTLVIKTFFSALVEDHNGTKQAVVLQPTSLEFAELILRFSFLLIDNIDIIIECIKEQTVVKNPVTNVTLHHGEHFFLTFRSVILDQMVENFENSLHCLVGDLSLDNFQWIIRILTELLQHAVKKQRKDLRTNTGDCFKKVVIQYWSSLSNITEKNTEDTYQFLGLLINFARAVPEPIGFLMAHEEVSRWVTSQITSEKLQPHHKIRALDLLVCLTGPQDVDNVELKKTMKLFKDQHIPQMSSELQVGSLEYSSFVSMFRKILLALEDSGSPTLLYSLVYITASETKHICENEIQQSLQTFIKKLDFRSQVQAIKVVYEFVFQENYDAQIRLNCTQRFIQTLLQGCRPAAAIAFYKDCITKLLQLVGDGLEKRDRLRAERQLVGKISAWNLLELMFLLLECSELESKECAITVAAFPGAVNTGKELIKDVSDKAYNYRKENIPIDMAGNDRIVELFRKSQCAAFSTLVAVISCTKTTAADAKFYAGLLFSENSKTKEVPWEKIVDTKKVYRLTLDWEEIPKRRKKMVNIRSEARTQRKLIAGFASQSIRYIPNSSQYLFDSTLNEDVTLFDMSTSIVSSQASTALQEQFSAPSLEIELECDDVNEHECMATLCGVIQHMVDRKISPLPAVGTVEDLPSWMEHLRKCLTDSRRPQNVRLFLMKLVLNMESVFQPFASKWINTVLKVIDDGVLGRTSNYLLYDAVAMLVEWRSKMPLQDITDRDLISQLLFLLLNCVQHSRRDVFKHNLEQICTVVELWKPNFNLPYQLLQDLIMKREKDDPRASEPGIQVAAILLANKLEPWNKTNKVQYLMSILRHMDCEKRKIYHSSSEVAGLALKYFTSRGITLDEDEKQFLSLVTDKLKSLKEKSKEKFITSLFAVQIHYPNIIRPFMTYLLLLLSKLYGGFRLMSLKIVYSRSGMPEEDIDGDLSNEQLYAELEYKGIFKLLSDYDPDQQNLVLSIVKNMVPTFKSTQLDNLIGGICSFQSHSKSQCRMTMYDILMWIYDNCKDLGGDLINLTKATLLKGLKDEDPFLQDTIFRYWRNENNENNLTSELMLFVLNDMYSPSTEKIFLGYAVQFLLEATVTSRDYDQKIFDTPLSKCQFEDFKMLLNWRAQHATNAPMFAQTLASQIIHSQGQSSSSEMGPLLRSTQASLAFQPTLTFQDDTSLNISSSLLFTTGSSEISSKSYKMKSFFGKRIPEPAQGTSDEVDASSQVPIPNLRRRFQVNQQRIHKFFAGQAIKQNERRKQLQEERSRRREANIASFRNYRVGDFPDIEIPYSAIIKPMQELGKRDVMLAQQLFVLMFEGLVNELVDKKASFMATVQTAMNSILYNEEFSTVLMRTLMEIALQHSKHISLDSKLITAASQTSGLFALGSLLLEECLIQKEPVCEPGPSKRSRDIQVTADQELWLSIAELYKSMDEWDVVHGIFRCHLSSEGAHVQEAIKWEAACYWSKAKEYYQKSLASMTEEDVLSDYCYEAYYKCLEHLSNWDGLSEEISKQVSEDVDGLWDEWYQEKLMPRYMLSQMQIMLDKGVDDKGEKVLEKINEWLLDKEKSNYLTNFLSEELAVMYLLQNNSSRSKQQVEHTLNTFLDTWAHLSPFSHKLRMKEILDLQKTAELQAYLRYALAEGKVSEARARDLVNQWKHTLPSAQDSLLHWDVRAMYRKKFTRQIESTHNVEAEKALTRTQLTLVDSAISQHNFHVARKYLGQTKNKRRTNGDEFKLEWDLRFVKASYLDSQLENNTIKLFGNKLKHWELSETRLDGELLKQYPKLQLKALQHVMSIVHGVLQQFDEVPDILKKVPADLVQKLAERVHASNYSNENLLDHVKTYGLKNLKDTMDLMGGHKRSGGVSESIAEAYLEIAKFCRNHYASSLNTYEYGSEVIKGTLRAMQFGLSEARQLFPCLLQVQGLDSPPLSELFTKECSEVPTWMFLGWINQLFANLNTSIGPILQDLILRLAQAYPQAIIYGFQLFQENCEIGTEQAGLGDFISRLRNMLFADTLIEKFLQAFSCLGQPYMMLVYFVRTLASMLQDQTPNKKSLSFVYDSMVKELFSKELFSNDIRNKIHGRAFVNISEYQNPLKKLKSQIKEGDKTVVNKLLEIKTNIEAEMESNRQTYRLMKDYSPWLSEFQSGNYSLTELEIPGQYTGDRRPLPQHHVKIVGFKQNVVIMKSIKKPLVIIILGSDAKEHKYLVKFGEDLRQDQRLQQLFGLMNKIMCQDPACRQRDLSLITYQVVPFSSHLGIVEWVNNTEKFSDLLVSALEKDEINDYKQAQLQYCKWIDSVSRRKTDTVMSHILSYRHYSREESIAAFREIVNMVPWDVLRRVIQKMSISPESYFSLRQNFASSYAVMCISHWLLGIGDRHLENTLVSLIDGRCVGIDFGYAFGAATQFIGVPELMPFRLTPHIVNLLQPLEEKGLLRETMIHCLRTLRSRSDILLATMEVFVQEPSMDWLMFARINKDSERAEKEEWYPQQKLNLAKMKLNGANPAIITKIELESRSKMDPDTLQSIIAVAVGNPNENIRAQYPDHHLDPDQQVDCLIDQATDYHILSKTFHGWSAWV